MVLKSTLGALCACLTVVSFNVSAELISIDWKVSGDNLITRDTATGLDWLDLTETVNRSYSDISSQLGAGGEFEGWRYASGIEVSSLYDSAGGNGTYDGWSTGNNGVVAPLLDLWGRTSTSVPQIDHSSAIISDLAGAIDRHWVTYATDENPTQDFLKLHHAWEPEDSNIGDVASALVKVSPVPVPSAIWLFGSGLIGLIGLARRRANA